MAGTGCCIQALKDSTGYKSEKTACKETVRVAHGGVSGFAKESVSGKESYITD